VLTANGSPSLIVFHVDNILPEMITKYMNYNSVWRSLVSIVRTRMHHTLRS